MSELPPIEPAPSAPPKPSLPWEAPDAGLGAIVPTALRVIANPLRAYSEMSLTVDLVRPIAYFVAWTLIGACISQLWSFLFFDSFIGVMRSLAGPQFEKLGALLQKPGLLQLVLGLVVTPLISLILLFIWSALVHLMLTLLGGANRGFGATLRVMCYAETTQVAVVFPFFGGVVGFVWRLILDIIGLSTAHETEGWKAALAVILPLVLCCICLVAGAVAFGAALGQAFKQMT